MNSKEFKKEFGKVAKSNGFKSIFGGWYKESSECIIILELQKSNFGNYFQLNIKVFINGAFGLTYTINKDLIKSSMGHINSGETHEYKDIFDFDKPMVDNKRTERLEILFKNNIIPFTEKALSKSGIRELANKGEILLLPAIKEELEKLSN